MDVLPPAKCARLLSRRPRTPEALQLFAEFQRQGHAPLTSPVLAEVYGMAEQQPVPPFLLDTGGGDVVARLQRELLAGERDGDPERVAQAERGLIEIFWAAPAVDGLAAPLTTSFGVVEQTSPDDAVDYLWALKYGSCFCAARECHRRLAWGETHNAHLARIEFTVPACGHALRFCAAHEPACWMCGCAESGGRRVVYQAVTDAMSMHRHCINEPCELCA